MSIRHVIHPHVTLLFQHKGTVDLNGSFFVYLLAQMIRI